MKVAVSTQSTNTKAAARVKDITMKAATTSTMQVAAKVKNIAMKVVIKIITTSTAAGLVAAAAVVVSGSLATANYAW